MDMRRKLSSCDNDPLIAKEANAFSNLRASRGISLVGSFRAPGAVSRNDFISHVWRILAQ